MNKEQFIKNSVLPKNLIVDFNQFAFRAKFNKDIQENGFNVNMWKHLILQSILSAKDKFDASNVYLCCDSKSWRIDYFPYYKFKRKEKQKSEGDDYLFFIENVNSFIEELKESFPFYVIKVDGAEGDDIIATLCKEKQSDCLNILLSSDKDFAQLNKFNNFFQYDVISDTFIEVSDWKYQLFYLCVKGDSGDGIPSYLSEDDIFTTGVRQKPIKETSVIEMFESAKNGIDFFQNDLQKTRFMRNQTLIDFDYIPTQLYKKIIDAIMEYTIVGTKKTMFYYFIERDMIELQNMISRG